MDKKHFVIMLPVNHKKATGVLMLKKSTNKLVTDFHSTRNTLDHFAHELYIVFDEKIKKGDWYLANQIEQCSSKEEADDLTDNCKKIIATTNSNLQYHDKTLISENVNGLWKSLPQIHQSFIEYFVSEYNKGNIITEVMVEYEYASIEKSYFDGDIEKLPLVVKINPDNTVNIITNTIDVTKDSWNRKEIEALLIKHQSDYRSYVRNTNPLNWSMDIKTWLNENL